MQFRDYLFPHNPRSIVVTGTSNLAVHVCPGWGDVVQNLGKRGRVVRCEGSFFGRSYREAAEQLEQFRRRSGDGTAPGTLLIPGMQPFLAHLKELVYEAQGDGRIISYVMVFQEHGEGGWA